MPSAQRVLPEPDATFEVGYISFRVDSDGDVWGKATQDGAEWIRDNANRNDDEVLKELLEDLPLGWRLFSPVLTGGLWMRMPWWYQDPWLLYEATPMGTGFGANNADAGVWESGGPAGTVLLELHRHKDGHLWRRRADEWVDGGSPDDFLRAHPRRFVYTTDRALAAEVQKRLGKSIVDWTSSSHDTIYVAVRADDMIASYANDPGPRGEAARGADIFHVNEFDREADIIRGQPGLMGWGSAAGAIRAFIKLGPQESSQVLAPTAQKAAVQKVTHDQVVLTPKEQSVLNWMTQMGWYDKPDDYIAHILRMRAAGAKFEGVDELVLRRFKLFDLPSWSRRRR